MLPALTGVRFFAAFHVMVHHFGDADHWDAPAWLRALGHAGPAAVTLFFVLSGFVLAHTYALPGRARVTGPVMYAARVARVMPLYLVAWALSAPLWFAFLERTLNAETARRAWVVHGLAGLFTVQAWLPPVALTWNPPAWSISVELFFYACFTALSARLVACRLRTAVTVAVVAYLCGLVAPTWYVLAAPAEDPVVHGVRNFVDFFPLLRLPDFVAGIVAARAWDLGVLPRRRAGLLVTLGIVGSVLVIATGVVHERIATHGLLVPFFVVTVWGLADGGGRWGPLFSNRVSTALGDASYGMYLLHMPIIFWAAVVAHHVSPLGIFADPAFTVPMFPVVIGVALGLHRWVELPARRWLRPRLQAWARSWATA